MNVHELGGRARRALLAFGLALGLGGCASLSGPPRDGAVSAPLGSLETRVAALEQADALYRARRWSEAQRAYEDLSARYPRNAHVWLRLGNTLARQGQYENAAAALQNAVLVEGTQGAAAFNLGLVRLAQAQSAFDYARTRLAGQPVMRRQSEALRARVEALIAELDTISMGHEAQPAALARTLP